MMITWLPWIFFSAAAAILIWMWRDRKRSTSSSTHSDSGQPQISAGALRRKLGDLGDGWLRAASAGELVTACALESTLTHLRRESKLSPAAFERDIAPAIDRFLEYVQLLPASESHHHAHVGGLAAHVLETTLAAVRLRNGFLLPPGGTAEEIDELRDHWTYSVLFGALLHDLGKVVSDLRIEWVEKPGDKPRAWLPLAGDLVATGAHAYRVRFAPKSERDYQAHRKLPLLLLHRIVPSEALAFLGRQPAVMQSLSDYLSGEDALTSAIAPIVQRADQSSAARNLKNGSRARFPSATAVPLVERMRDAMRSLLADGSLPLNRDGAAGWVQDGAVFFVAKRVADAVRERMLARSQPSYDGVPSGNDRLFDVWQDYQVIEPNPATGQAIWPMVVRGKDYCHSLAMLKFPLSTLFDDPQAYPAEFAGHLEPQASDRDAGDGAPGERKEGPRRTIREPRFGRAGEPDAVAASDDASTKPNLARSAMPDSVLRGGAEAMPTQPHPTPDTEHADADYLDAEDAASAHPLLAEDGPVVPHVDVPDQAGEVSELALQFMSWLKAGLASGAIRYNEAGAMVHFVEEGMALVSPRVFREFVDQADDAGIGAGDGRRGAPASRVQREVIKAGWHQAAPGNSNILQFAVVKRGGALAGKLAAVVIRRPERWVNPVPPNNPNLKPFDLFKSAEQAQAVVAGAEGAP